MQTDEDVFFVLIATEKRINISRPTSSLELKLSPIEIHELANATLSESNYLHLLFVLKL